MTEKYCWCGRKATRFHETNYYSSGDVSTREVQRCGYHGRQFNNEGANTVYTQNTLIISNRHYRYHQQKQGNIYIAYCRMYSMNQAEELEILRDIINECLILAQETNDLLDENNDEAISKVSQIISNLELGVNAL